MGVNLSSLIEKEEISIDSLENKKLGIDAYNMLYQFLASIRGAYGLPLADSRGNVTSHLTGLFYRTVNFVDKGLKPVFVFDGVPSDLKKETLKKRREVRTDAEKKSSDALQTGDLAEAKKFGSRALRLDKSMVEEAKELLCLLGVPVVTAPEEGEAQASVMNSSGLIDGVISQDFDCLLFGGKDLYRHIGFTGKRKVPGKNFFVDIKPEHISLESVLKQLKIDRRQLIWLGILIGTDFNDKFPKIGPKTALKLVREKDSFEDIVKETGFEPDFDYKKVEKIFLEPVSKEVSEKEIVFGSVDEKGLLEFLVEKHDFSKERVSNTIENFVSKIEEREKQKSLDQWF